MSLGVETGDAVRVLVPRVTTAASCREYAAFTVGGVFEAGVPDHDTIARARRHLTDASDLKGLSGAAEGVALRFDDPLAVREFARRATRRRSDPELALLGLDRGVPQSLHGDAHREAHDVDHPADDRRRRGVQHRRVADDGGHRQAEGHRDLAHLRARCAPRRANLHRAGRGDRARRCAARRVALGLALRATTSTSIVPWLEQTFGFQIMPGDIYYVTEMPSEVQLFDVIAVPVAAFALAMLATLYPARRAAAIAPASALRYD